MTQFEFATAGKIIFGPGVFSQIASHAARLGVRATILTGRSPERASRLMEMLRQAGLQVSHYAVSGEPAVEDILAGLELIHKNRSDLAIAYGGGSAIDAAKALSVLATNPGEVGDYLEVVGLGKPLLQPGLPVIAIPTTSGTGAEVSRNAVLAVRTHAVKVSLRSESMLPRLALVDPELTLSLPPQITAFSGMDALTQLIEPYVCNQPNPLVDGICRQGIAIAAQSLRRAYLNGADLEARTGMSAASLFGGLALANARLGAVHGFAGPLGGMYSAPHGAICARLLPEVMAANLQALSSRSPDSSVIGRYAEIARILTGDPQASALDGVEWVRSLVRELAIPGLSTYGITLVDLPTIVERSARASSMKGNPVVLSSGEMSAILERAL